MQFYETLVYKKFAAHANNAQEENATKKIGITMRVVGYHLAGTEFLAIASFWHKT